MTLLTVFQEASTVIGMDVPDSVYGSSAREHQEIGVIANTMGRRIVRAYEWQELKRSAKIIGNGTGTDYPLQTDYDRMPKQASMWPDNLMPPFTHITDYDKWLELQVNFSMLGNVWTLLGNRIHILPLLAANQAVNYYYQSDLYVLGLGGKKDHFDNDADQFVLNEELLKLGIIWQWKANKGHAYAEDMSNYEELLATLTASNIGPRRIRIGVARMPTDAVYAYPGTVGLG